MMRIINALLVSAFVLGSGSSLQGQAKKGNKRKTVVLKTTPQDYQALARMKGIYGRLTAVDFNNNTMTLRVEYQVAQPIAKANKGGKGVQPKKRFTTKKKQPRKKLNGEKNRNKNKNRNRNKKNKKRNKNKKRGTSLQQLAREYQQILRIQNPKQRQSRMRQFMAKLNNVQRQKLIQQQQFLRKQAQQSQKKYQQLMQKQKQFLQKQLAKNPRINPQRPNFKLVTVAKELELPIAGNVRVARKNLPFEYDDKGFVKKYTDEEKKKLLDGVLPGYKATTDDVTRGQIVYVYFGKVNAAGDKKKQGINLDPAAAENAPSGLRVNGIVILVDYDLSLLPAGNGKKKKRK